MARLFCYKKGNVLQKQSFIQQEKAAFGLGERIFTENPIPNKAFSCYYVKLQNFLIICFLHIFVIYRDPKHKNLFRDQNFLFIFLRFLPLNVLS